MTHNLVQLEADGSYPSAPIPATSQGQFVKVGVTDDHRLTVDLGTTSGDAGTPSEDVLSVQGLAYASDVTITRPSNTTAYTAGDVIGQADASVPANAGTGILEFAAIGPEGGHVFLTDVNLQIEIAALPTGMGTFRLHLYNAAPDAILDNAAWDLASAGDRTKYLGYTDLVQPADLGSTIYSQNPGINRKLKLAAGVTSLFGVLQTAAGYTPASGSVAKIRLHTVLV